MYQFGRVSGVALTFHPWLAFVSHNRSIALAGGGPPGTISGELEPCCCDVPLAAAAATSCCDSGGLMLRMARGKGIGGPLFSVPSEPCLSTTVSAETEGAADPSQDPKTMAIPTKAAAMTEFPVSFIMLYRAAGVSKALRWAACRRACETPASIP